jgi:hypothetical protein
MPGSSIRVHDKAASNGRDYTSIQESFHRSCDTKRTGQPELKRWLLLFDEVVVDDLEIAIRLASSDGEYKAAELEWLAGQGLLRQCKFDELPPLKDSALQRVIDEANGYYAARLARWISLSQPDYDFFGGSPRTALRATPAESSRGIDCSVRGSQEE